MRTIPTNYKTLTIPQFTHDCNTCVFLGHREGLDIYVCPRDGVLGTIIWRYGNDGPEYGSGATFLTCGECFGDGSAAYVAGPEQRGPNVAAAVFIAYVLHNGLLKQAPSTGKL